jgi:hypothetical protein
LTDGRRCDEGALDDDAGLASGHAGDRGALLRLAGSTPMDGGLAYRGSEGLSEHREGVWLGQLRVCKAWMRPLMEISDEARLKHPRPRDENVALHLRYQQLHSGTAIRRQGMLALCLGECWVSCRRCLVESIDSSFVCSNTLCIAPVEHL